MTDYQLPVLRRLTADEVEPGMTIAGKIGDTQRIGVADEFKVGYWYTAAGEPLGSSHHDFDLLVEAPKPPITLPTDIDAVIRYTDVNVEYKIAHRVYEGEAASWLIPGIEALQADDQVLRDGAEEGYELAVWTKPGDQK